MRFLTFPLLVALLAAPVAAGTLDPTLLGDLSTSATCSIFSGGVASGPVTGATSCQVGTPTGPGDPPQTGSSASIDILTLGFSDSAGNPTPGFLYESDIELISSLLPTPENSEVAETAVDLLLDTRLTTDGPLRNGVLMVRTFGFLDSIDVFDLFEVFLVDGVSVGFALGGGPDVIAFIPVQLGRAFDVSYELNFSLRAPDGGGYSGSMRDLSINAYEWEGPLPDSVSDLAGATEVDLSAVPEPSTWLLMLSGLALAFARRRRQ